MPNRAYIVNPVVSSNEAGAEESIQDFEVIGDHSATVAAFNRGFLDDFTEDSHGRFIYNSIEDDESVEQEGGLKEEYYEALFETNTDLQDAIDWAADGLDEDTVQLLNKDLQSDDPDRIHKAIDFLLARYGEADVKEASADAENDTDEENFLDELSPETKEAIGEVREELIQTEPAGMEEAESWDELMEQAKAEGNETLAGVAAATSMFHQGKMTADQALQWVLTNYPLEEVSMVYEHLKNQ